MCSFRVAINLLPGDLRATAGFLSLSITDPGPDKSPFLGVGMGWCSSARGMFGRLPALYQIDARNAPCPSYDNAKGPWIMPDVSWKTSCPQLKTTGLKGEMRIQQRMTGAAGMTHLDGMDGHEERHEVFSKHTRGGSDAGFANNSPEEGTSA